MNWFSESWRRVHALAQRRALERGLDEEIEFHLTKQVEKNLRQGMSFDEARRHALIKFGGVQHMKERTRDEFRMMSLEDWFREIRYTCR